METPKTPGPKMRTPQAHALHIRQAIKGMPAVDYSWGVPIVSIGKFFAQGEDAQEFLIEAELMADKFGIEISEALAYIIECSGTEY
jgi:hypothetical protein